jgi:DNA-binding transcriptional regulator LsrR (DeoR family)
MGLMSVTPTSAGNIERGESEARSSARPPSENGANGRDRRLDLAARAAWLYHARGQRQDEIARTLNISRQVVQRLIAMATSEKLIRFQLIHPLADCVVLADRLADRFHMEYVEVVPAAHDGADDVSSIATAAALYIERLFLQTEQVTIGMGGHRVMRDVVTSVPPMRRPAHRLVSLMGNLTRQGRAGHYDVIMGLAERTGVQCYPLPMPVVANTVEEKTVLQAQIAFQSALKLVNEASVLMMGIGYINDAAPIYRDGFITSDELQAVLAAGAVGEILGYCFDAAGNLLDVEYHERLTSARLMPSKNCLSLLIQCGERRVPAIHAALTGQLVNGLITNETTASRLLEFT